MLEERYFIWTQIMVVAHENLRKNIKLFAFQNFITYLKFIIYNL